MRGGGAGLVKGGCVLPGHSVLPDFSRMGRAGSRLGREGSLAVGARGGRPATDLSTSTTSLGVLRKGEGEWLISRGANS